MSYTKIYTSFNIKRHIHARVIFRCYGDLQVGLGCFMLLQKAEVFNVICSQLYIARFWRIKLSGT